MEYIKNLLLLFYWKCKYRCRIKMGYLSHDPMRIKLINYGLFISGKNLIARETCNIRIEKNGKVLLGDNVFFNHNCNVTALNNIYIGDNVKIGPNVVIVDHDHDYKAEDGIESNQYSVGKVIIEDDVWIGANSVILKDTVIREGTVIAAGSVIKGKYEPHALVVQKKKTSVVKIGEQ